MKKLYTPTGADCPSCPFNSQVPVGPELIAPQRRQLIIVLEGPGYTEAAVGVPLAGKTGGFMDDVFQALGLARGRVSILNSTACLPVNNPGPKEFRRAVNCCQPRLARELAAQAPQPGQIILAMGEKAMASLCGFRRGGITAWRGYPLPALDQAFSQAHIFPTFHPSYVLREPCYWPILKTDVRRALALQDGELSLNNTDPPITLSNAHETYQVITEIHRRALHEGGHGCVGLDIETGGKNWLEAPLLCIGVADTIQAVSIPASHDEQVDGALRDILRDPQVGKVFQNRNVDLIGLRAAGYEVSEESPNNFDLLDAGRIAFPGVEHDLGALASYFLFAPRWKSDYHGGKDKGEDSWEKDARDPVKFVEMQRYNALDAFRTRQLKPYLQRALNQAKAGP